MLLIAIPLAHPDHAASLETRRVKLDALVAKLAPRQAVTLRPTPTATPKPIATSRNIDYIQNLPTELLVEIGHHLLTSDPDDARVLAEVSQHWRAVFLDDANVWSTLKLGSCTVWPSPKVDAYWKRSKGMLVALEMDEVSVEVAANVLATVQSSFERLATLRWTVPVTGTLWNGLGHELRKWRGRFCSLRLLRLGSVPARGPRRFVPTVNVSADVWSLLSGPCVLESLALCSLSVDYLAPPLSLGSVASIRHLDLSSTDLAFSGVDLGDASHFLDLVPNLVSLTMPGSAGPFFVNRHHRTVPIILPDLRWLNVSKSRLATPAPPIALSCPRLQQANLSHTNWRAGDAILPHDPSTGTVFVGNVGHLTYLNLTHTPVAETAVLDGLPHMPRLKILSLASSSFTNKMVEALVLGQDQVQGGGAAPRLEQLDLSFSGTVTGGPLCRLVKSRKGHGRDGKGLRSLAVDGCPLIEKKAIEWLKKTVERFSGEVAYPREEEHR